MRVASDLSCTYIYYEWIKGIGNIYNKTITEIISLLNQNYINYENQIIDLIYMIKNFNY